MKTRNYRDAVANFNDNEKELDRYDPAWAKAALFFRDRNLHFGHNDKHEGGLIRIREQLETRRKRYEAGSTIDLLHAIKICAKENLPMPTWLALAFQERFESFGSAGGATSLDDVFSSKGTPTNTSKKAAQAAQDGNLGALLRDAVWNVALPVASRHTGLDTAIEEVLKTSRWGVGKTKAKALVTMVDKQQSELVGGQTLSQFFAIRRKRVT